MFLLYKIGSLQQAILHILDYNSTYKGKSSESNELIFYVSTKAQNLIAQTHVMISIYNLTQTIWLIFS